MKIKFEWDEEKEKRNIKKHGLSFKEAATVFLDEAAILFDDPEHSEEEERFLILGMTSSANLCIVCHCYRATDTTIRIISARGEKKKEEKIYVRGI